MNAPFKNPEIDPVDTLLMDAARRIQLSPSRHKVAEANFNALCKHVDREGSPLAGKVVQCYPSGSFSIGTAILSHVSTAQHDIDVVVELNFSPLTKPAILLELLYQAINGEKGSRYHGQVRKNSRCVTVTYEDKTSVDLMPVARLPGTPERAGNLFHAKPEAGEEYHKPVNPWGFAEYFNNRTEVMTEFAKAFASHGVEILAKAATDPLPEHVPLTEKSPRVVALQLAKRGRDISYRRRDKKLRKPPAVVMAGMSLEMGPVKPRLIDELIAVVDHMAAQINAATYRGERFRFFNPAYRPDEFTDRWPENIEAQKLYAADLRQFKAALLRLRDGNLSPEQIKSELEVLFGESVAVGVVGDMLERRAAEASSGGLRFGAAGRVLTGAAAASAISRPARASTFEGGTLPR